MDGKQPCCSSGTFPPGDSVLLFKNTVRRSTLREVVNLEVCFGDVMPPPGSTEQLGPAASYQDSEMSQRAKVDPSGVEETLHRCLL